jgi:WD40 repeat protein
MRKKKKITLHPSIYLSLHPSYAFSSQLCEQEFTTFLIESAKVQHFSVSRIKEYSLVELADRYLDEVVRNVICFDTWDRIVMCGRNKRMTILHPGDLDHPLNVVDHGTAVLNAEYIKPLNYLVTAASDMTIRVFDAQTLAMKKSMSETESQTSLRWHPSGRLFSGSRLGSIGIWDLESVRSSISSSSHPLTHQSCLLLRW